jgi:hypothetical protein
MDKAAKLLQGVTRASRVALGLPAVAGCGWDHDSGETGAAAGTGTAAKGTSSGGGSGSKGSPAKASGGKQAKGHGTKGGKADKHHRGAAAAAAAAGGGVAAEGVDPLVQAQHQQLLVEGLMQLAEVSSVYCMALGG